MNIDFNAGTWDLLHQCVSSDSATRYIGDREQIHSVSVMALIHHGVNWDEIGSIVSDGIPIAYRVSDISSYSNVSNKPAWLMYLEQFGSVTYDGRYIYYDRSYREIEKHMAEVATSFFPDVISTPDEWEVGLMQSIVNSDQTSFNKYRDEIESKIANTAKSKLVNKFEGMSFGNKAKALLQNIKDLREQIKSMNDRISSTLASLAQTRREYEIARRIPDNSTSVIREYILNDPNIKILSACSTYIRFEYDGFMDSFNSDVFEEEYDYEDSYAWEWAEENGARFIIDVLYQLVVNRKGKLKMNSYWEMNSDRGLICRDSQLGNRWDYVPNPHLYRYRCLGGNEANLNNANMNGDWEEALDIAVMCNGLVNFGENETMEYFYPMLYERREKPIIVLPDGRTISFAEAISEWNL